MPGAHSSFLLLLVGPGAPSSVLAARLFRFGVKELANDGMTRDGQIDLLDGVPQATSRLGDRLYILSTELHWPRQRSAQQLLFCFN